MTKWIGESLHMDFQIKRISYNMPYQIILDTIGNKSWVYDVLEGKSDAYFGEPDKNRGTNPTVCFPNGTKQFLNNKTMMPL